MEIVKTIAEKAVEPIIYYIVAPIARQVSYLIFYKDNFKNLKDQYTELKRVKGTISHEVEVERKNGRQIYDAVQNWLNKVDEIVEEVEQLSKDPRHRNVACCKGPFPNFKSRHQLSRKAKKMAGNVAQVMQQKDNIGPLAFLPDLEGVGSTSATSSEKLESRKKMKEDIVLALRDPHISRVGVYGLGGVGKSTLVKEVAKQVEDDKLFDKVVMANISQEANLEKIQCEIADFLGLRFEEMAISGRAARLQQRIKNERSILVILDDFWEILELDKLGLPINNHKGCKLLLISRKLDILQTMGTQKDFVIDVLNDKEAWSLFEDMVGDVVKDVNLRDVAIQVAQKCAGLIVLIVTVARALKNKDDIDSWKDALNQLKTVGEEPMSKKIYSALEFSYNHLDGDDMKALFLLCGSLPPKLDVDYLLKCVMGLRIFKNINSPKDARLKLHRLISSLKASCLLLEDNSNMVVKMHDIVQEVAVSIASRYQHVLTMRRGGKLTKWPSEEFLQRCTQIILHYCHIPKLPERLECPNIKLFYFYNMNESLSVPDYFFAGMKNLKMLQLSNMHFPSLPQSFHSLIDLQTLCLDWCALGDMTNIGALMNLQILCLFSSSMIKLPTELGQLINLRMLDLTNSGIEIFPSNIISKLTKLEELYWDNTSIKWEQEDSNEENENASLSELRHLTNLTAFEIQIKGARKIVFVENSSPNSVAVDENIEFGSLQSLTLGYLPAIDDFYSGLLESSTTTMQSLSLDNNVPSSFINSKVKFSNLETLKLSSINLENIWQDDHVSIANSFHKLANLSVEGCSQLKYLFSSSIVGSFPNLKQLEIRECEMMEEIISREGKNGAAIDEVGLPKLETLVISNMKRLKKVWHSQFDGLKTMEVNNCEKLINIFPYDMQGTFGSLETLKIFMQRPLFVIEEVIPKLKEWTLENKEAIMILQDPQWKDHYLGKLNLLRLSKFEYKAASTFLDSVVQKAPNLKILVVRDSSLKEIFQDKRTASKEGKNEIKTQLQKLSLINLQLLHICREGCQVDPILEVLEVLYVTRCDGLKTLVPSSVTFSHLIYLKIEKCNGLMNLLYPSTASSLVKLRVMILRGCNSLEEIVTEEMNETRDEIVLFLSLRNLVLERLPRLNCFSSSKCFFKFPFLEKVVVRQCPRMKIFCETETSAPMLKKVIKDGKDGEWCWKGNLNGTINKIFLDKAAFHNSMHLDLSMYPELKDSCQLTYLEVQNCNGLIHLITSSTAKSLVSLETMIIRNCNSLEQVVVEDRDESKDAIAFRNLCVLELECLPRLKMFCSSSYCLLELPWLYEVVISNCPRMEIFSLGKTDAPMLERVLTQKEDEKEQWQGGLDTTVTKIFLSDQVVETTKQEIPNLPSSSDDRQQEEKASSTDPQDAVAQNVPSSSSTMIPNIATMYPSPSQVPKLATGQITGLAKGTQEMGENIERPMVEAVKIAFSPTGVCSAETCRRENLFNQPKVLVTCDNNEAVGSQEIREIMDKPLIQSDQHAKKLATTENTESHDSSIGTREMYDTMKKPSILVAQNVPSSSSTMIPDAARMYPSPSQAPELAIGQITGLAKGTRETGDNVERPIVEAAKIALSPTGVCNAEGSQESETCPKENLFHQPKILVTCDKNEAVGSQEIRETLDKPLIQSDQHAQNLATIENTEKSRDSYIETQKISDTNKKPSSPTKQNVPNSTMISDIVAIDPSSSKSPQPMTSTILESDAYINDKWLNYISKQNLPYLEFGLKRHPQVLNWFNTKRRGVFVAIFTEVTRILRTTRGCDLTEDDQNYIRDCCASLEAIGFDASWLNYVYGCIESCGNGDELIRKLEETEAKASTLRNELASVEVLLASMRDKASKLKEMGNYLLGRFGMCVDNFKAVKDPNSGSYFISFQR
ncbi:hypothetical protein K1719_016748 [Acacia pycnantha]|nr:hypothetical protein K1719_016748 [Acacia pycnantha]